MSLKKILGLIGICSMALAAGAQTIGVQTNGHGEAPLSYGRNIKITTDNDSTALVISKPLPAGGLTNDWLDLFAGSQPAISIAGEGSLSNFGTNAALHTLQNLGIESGSNGTVTVTEILSNNFAVPFLAPPAVIIGHNTNTYWITTVASNYFLITNNAGTLPFYWTAIGTVNQTH